MTDATSEAAHARKPGREATDFALVDPALLGLNLFKALPRKGRTKARLQAFDMTTEHDGRNLRISGSYALGPDDLAILLAVIALAGPNGKEIKAAKSEASRVAIVDGLGSEGEVVNSVHLRLRTTLSVLCKEAGLEASGTTYTRVTESLWRMANMTYADLGPVRANSRRMYVSGSQRLLSFSADEATKEVTIVINARFSGIVLGPAIHMLHERIDMRESRSLNEVARLVHFSLCLMVARGRRMRIGLDRIVARIYGGPPADATQASERRREVRAALRSIAASPSWEIEENRFSGMLLIQRSAPPERAKDAGAEGDGTAVRRSRRRGRGAPCEGSAEGVGV